MLGRQCTKSLIRRLEELEAQTPGSLVFAITENGKERRVNFRELMAMREPPHTGEDGTYYTGFPQWRIVEGNNLVELDAVIAAMFGGLENDGH